MPQQVVIIGGGQAGYQTAASLRTEGYSGGIVLVSEEAGLPYQRPPLSKAYLLGKQTAEQVALRPAAFYAKHNITLLEDRAVRIDRTAKRVELASGAALEYEFLVLAMGSRNRVLRLPGGERALYVRSLDEARVLRERLTTALPGSLAVIGGGFIGLEVAAAAHGLGWRVQVIEAQDRLMARAVAPVISTFFAELHARHGVTLHLNAQVKAVEPDAVLLANGQRIAADVVVAGIGVEPEVALAQAAGLDCENGVVTDAFLRTADASIYAIGDCCAFPNAFTGSRTRLESVQNAVDQAVCVARGICGHAEEYREVPWFWTEQFDARLQMAGLAPQWDEMVLRGEPASGSFSALYFAGGRLRAADSINRPLDHLGVRRLLAKESAITPAQAADLSVELKTWL